MKKLLTTAAAITLAAIGLLASCTNPNDAPVVPEDPVPQPVSLLDLADTAWFYNDVELQFPKTGETIYIKYLPDTLNVTKWISLSEKANGQVQAKIEWSTDIREIGRTSDVELTKLSDKLNVKCSFFDLPNMESYEGVTASAFNVSEVPELKAEYLSNFSGAYTLSNNYELTVGAKLGISKSTTEYWNANVINATVLEDGTYDLLLAHSSSANGSGSIDPGITGKEPFISKQGLFWSHLTLTQAPGSQWTVCWNSEWKDTPYEALNTDKDMKATFTGPATTDIHYSFKFFLGDPQLRESGYGAEAVDVEEIGSLEIDSPLPTTMSWKEILSEANLSITLPEGKLADYWWYNTDSLSPILESSVYKLSDSWEPALYEYNFYLAVKEKPASSGPVFIPEGTYENTATKWAGYILTVKGNTCTLEYPEGSKTFDVVPDFESNPNYQDFDDDYPNIRIFYNLTNKYRVKLYISEISSVTLVEWEK